MLQIKQGLIPGDSGGWCTHIHPLQPSHFQAGNGNHCGFSMQDAGLKEHGGMKWEAPLSPDWQDHNSFRGLCQGILSNIGQKLKNP